MQQYTQPQLKEKYEKLPQDIKDAIFSVDVAEAIESISKKYNLLIDKMGLLAEEAGRVMLGVTHPNNFIPNLSKKLGVEKEVARKIAEEINQQIFQKVRESLKKIHGIEDKKEESEIKTPPVGQMSQRLEKKETPSKPELKPLEIRPISPLTSESKIKGQELKIEETLRQGSGQAKPELKPLEIKKEMPIAPPAPIAKPTVPPQMPVPKIKKEPTLPPKPTTPAITPQAVKPEPPPNLPFKKEMQEIFKPVESALPPKASTPPLSVPLTPPALAKDLKEPPQINKKIDPYRESI